MLISIVDPSAIIRKEFQAHTAVTHDGRVLHGLMRDSTTGDVTLINARGEASTIPRQEIDRIEESMISLMPENLLKPLTPSQLRDLFAFLESDSTAIVPRPRGQE